MVSSTKFKQLILKAEVVVFGSLSSLVSTPHLPSVIQQHFTVQGKSSVLHSLFVWWYT